MARFAIKSPDGLTTRYTGTPVYHGTHLKPAYLEFREIASPTKIAWQVGDYVDYTRTGLRYKLYSVPQPTKQAVANAAGDSFVYKDVQLFAATKDLEICPFLDIVFSDNQIHFTTLADVSTYEDVYGIARRIQANLDSFYGEGIWEIKVVDTSDSDLRGVLLDTKEFSLSNGTCLDALSQIYSQWKGLGWFFTVESGVNTITIGKPNEQRRDNTTEVFAYGVGNGLTVIKKEQSEKNELATRLYAYGSTRNLIARYYNNLTPAIKDAQSVYIPNLMIPLSHWGETDDKKDARKAYLEADGATLARYGLRPKRIDFDGNGDYEEIYPSVETMTAGQLRAAMQSTDPYYPSATFAADHQRVDEIVGAENPSDDGVFSTQGGGKYIQTVSLLGVSRTSSYTFAKGQESAKIPLQNISVATNITATGKVRVTPAFSAIITSGVNLGALSVRLWLEIAGVKYGEVGCPIVRGANNTYTVTCDAPYDINTEDIGSVQLVGYIFAAPTNKDASSVLNYALNIGTTTLEVETALKDTFKVQIRQIGFDISKQQSAISDGLCTIAFKSGWCAGREFTVKKCEYQSSNDRWVLTIVRQNDESLSQYFPNSVYKIEAGDRFVLTDLTMPEIYITAAMERLYDRASEVLAALSTPKMVYEPQVDAKALAASPEKIMEGMWMPVRDDDLIDDTVVVNGQTVHQEWVLIDTVEIDEGAEAIPTYKITLQDEKRESFLAKISKQSGRNTRDISEIVLKDLRENVEETTPSTVGDEEISVEVVASHPIIGYEHSFDEEPVNEVTLTCQTTGINNPTYQWYFKAQIGWTAITGATGQSYIVDPDSSQYYLNGEIVEDFRCVVNGDQDLSASVQIMKVLANAMTLSLSNPAHIFAAGVQFAEAAEDRSDIVGYIGIERFATKVKTSAIRFLDASRTPISVTYTGGNLQDSQGRNLTDSQGQYLTVGSGTGAAIYDSENNLMMSVEVVNNETPNAYIKVTTTTYLNLPAGIIEIPVIIREADASAGIAEKVALLYYSWGLALQGNTSFNSVVFTRTNGTPTAIADADGDFEHPVPTQTYTDSAGNSYTWSDGIPSGDATLWMAMRVFSANGYYPQEEHWSTPSPAFDTADLDFEYSALATNPGTPSNPATGANWHNTATANDIWMALRKKSGGVWGAWEVMKIKGEKGDSPLMADLDNEMDGVAVGSDGVLDTATTLTANTHIYYGDTEQDITGIVASGAPSGVTVTTPKRSGSSTIYSGVINFALASGLSSSGPIEISLLITCSYGSRTVKFTILLVKEGEDGVVYKLIPDYDTVKGTRNNDNTISYTPTAVKVSRYTHSGSGAMSPSTYGEIRYSVDGGSTILADYNASTGVAVSNAVTAGKIIFYWYSASGSSGVMIDRETIPIVVDGAKGQDGARGYSANTVYLYRRSSSGAPSVPSSNYVYRFADGHLYATNDTSFSNPLSTLENWHTEIPSGDDPCYVTMAFVQGNGDTVTITGGATTASTPGDWTPATRLTGDNGLQGKVMRGINVYDSTYGAGVKTQTVVEYEGLKDTDTSHIYYDMVYVESSGTRTYYYCQNAMKGSTKARQIIPGSETDAVASRCWIVATNFDFIATRVLLASNAFIDIMSGNGVYMYDTGQDYVVAGLQGGTGVNFFAGTHPETSEGAGDAVTPANAPFRVNYDGSVVASNMNITGGKIVVDSEVEQLDGNRVSIKTNHGVRAGKFMLYNGSGNLLKQFFVDDTLSASSPLMSLTTAGGLIAISVANGDVLLSANSNNKIGSEFIISSPTAKHIVICNHGEVPAIADRDANTLYFEKAS